MIVTDPLAPAVPAEYVDHKLAGILAPSVIVLFCTRHVCFWTAVNHALLSLSAFVAQLNVVTLFCDEEKAADSVGLFGSRISYSLVAQSDTVGEYDFPSFEKALRLPRILK